MGRVKQKKSYRSGQGKGFHMGGIKQKEHIGGVKQTNFTWVGSRQKDVM